MEMRSRLFPLLENDLVVKGAKLLLTVMTKKHRSTLQIVLFYTLPDDTIACYIFGVNMVDIRLTAWLEFILNFLS